MAGCAKGCAHAAPPTSPSSRRRADTTSSRAARLRTRLAGATRARRPSPIGRCSKALRVKRYETDGAAIYAESFAMIRAEADLARFTAEEERSPSA